MGRIKTQLVKRIALKLMRMDSDRFKKDFSENKKILAEVSEINSKKLRNIIAGYLTRLVRQQEVSK
ncbi:MAG: 30S ribosomal protein S17e [Nanoarchaeota archaeon]|jgi:small subunit ribosomal protein S17e|nr:30S ribosomal protein S17e [Nanoarchaeota archaeon]|tara:strand:- start:20224 stop:20421 length:198 start_codon:yes stop_codon:yes gene_type:complete